MENSKIPPCGCTDGTDCDFRCLDFSITEVCPHDIAVIKVIATLVTCETTQLVCVECGQALEEPKTDC